MHELGLIIDVVEKVDRIAEEQNLKKMIRWFFRWAKRFPLSRR